MTEENAIRLCLKHRDPRGFEFLVDRYRREAYYHAFGFLGSEAEAADACQDCFTKAFVAMPRLEALDAFYPWFYRILKNHCLNLLARRRTAQRYASEQHAPRAESQTPALLCALKDDKAQVWRVLKQLEAKHRSILLMKYVEGRSYDEIAAILGIPRGTVMSRLFHARKAFRQHYLNSEIPR